MLRLPDVIGVVWMKQLKTPTGPLVGVPWARSHVGGDGDGLDLAGLGAGLRVRVHVGPHLVHQLRVRGLDLGGARALLGDEGLRLARASRPGPC